MEFIMSFLGEFIGTMLLVVFGGGVVAGVVLKETKAENAGWMVIATGWGLGVVIAIYAAANFSGAHLNPAVTIALASVGDFDWNKVPIYILAQMLGAFSGAVIVWMHYLPHWKETKDPLKQLAVFSTIPAIRSKWSNLVSEIIGSFMLLFGIFAIGLSLGATTGYAINPARDLGPRIAHFMLPIVGKGNSDWSYSWIPVVGPILGGSLGALMYKAMFKHEIYPLFYVVVPIILLIMAFAVVEQKHSI
jgi:glycerol uptake facilitator protein